mmetsp:Transcript_7970/g.18802  ORF Transcript_7970/g.18802 Transcript_7970/m.18802 type:complete len:302 (-) Transcript_7970:2168-3073(-)
MVLAELAEGHEGPGWVLAHPPDVAPDSGDADVEPGQEVPGEHPAVDELLGARARRARHNARLCRVEGQSRRRETIRHEVDPEEGHRRQNLGKAEDDREEDAHNLADVGRDQVADEGLGVGVDSSPLLNRAHNRREVVVGQYHLRRTLRHRRPGSHCDADVRCLEGGRVVDSVPGHRGRVSWSAFAAGDLEQLDDVLLVDGLCAREKARVLDRLRLLRVRHRRELLARERLAGHVLASLKDADHSADGLCSLGVVARDHHDTDACFLALPDRVLDLLPGRVEDASEADESEVRLDLLELLGV